MVSIKRKEIKKKVSEKLGAFIREDVKTKDLKNLERLIFLIALLALALTGLQLNRAQSYRKYERIRFTSAGATLYANLYYPTKNLSFQEKRPLLIFCHGIGSKRDFDLRIPIEFTKRGFYVAALDYQGHGESGGNINNIDPHLDPIDSPGPALAQDCTKLLEKLKTMAFYSNVNTSQIGLIGHSLGGLVVLMNQALNPEFKYTVAWAPLVNFVPPQFGLEWQGYENFIPVNLLNSNNTDNLLIIMHTQDEVLDFKANALKAKQLTNCTVINITKPLLGGGHQLFSNEVLAYSIRWFEEHFFNSSVKNGPISISFIWNYILIILNLVLLIFIISLLISQSSKYFHLKPELIDQDKKKGKRIVVELKKISKVALILIYSSLFIINWQIFTTYFGVIGIFYASLLFSAAFLLVKGIKYFWRFKKEKVESMRKAFINLMKEEVNKSVLAYTLVCAVYFIIVYLLFSFYYPFAFMWPSNIMNILLSFFFFPVYFSIEILFRKLIYPNLSFLKSEKSKARITTITAVIIYVNLMLLARSYSYLPSVLFTFIVLLIVTIFNTIIYEHTRQFSAVLISSFLIISLFFSAVISNVVGVGAVSLLF